MPAHHKRQLTILGGILASFRHRKHLTPTQLASHLNKPESFVAAYESGKHRLDLPELVDIADALGIDVIEILDRYQQSI